ncbi:MAG: hypothetical protein PVJ33_07740 [Lysobacterales bacterium]|jgi:hypothetical protein
MNMRTPYLAAVCACTILACPPLSAQTAQESELDALRQEIQSMRQEYESRISDLEARLEAAEQAVAEAAASPPAAQQSYADTSYQDTTYASANTVSVARDRSFNPAIGVTFQGQAWAYQNDPDNYVVPGFPLAGESGPAPEGLSLGETEISMSANVDDKFTAMINMPVKVEDGEASVELEEAWIETLGLPAGLAVRMGRFYSSLGYLNSQHSHTWDFADAPLVYEALLGTQYTDTGLQLRWLAPTDFYLELTGEVYRGDRYPAGGAGHSGFGTRVLSAKTGGDVGYSSSWLFGLAWLSADAVDRASGDPDDPLLFNGDVDLYAANFVWKWAPNGNWRQRNFKFQAEYLWRNEDGAYTLPGQDPGPWDTNQGGWYAQAVYQPFPQWRIGGRVERMSGDDPGGYWLGTPLDPMGHNPARYSLMVDWSNSEFSRLRLQYNYDRSSMDSDNQLGLQYIFSIGAHGAHTF